MWIAVPTAVAGAASFGLASAVQHRVTKEVTEHRMLRPGFLFGLIRKPVWLLSIVTVVVGLSLQVVALAFGPLVLVQPLLVTSVLFGAAFAAWMAHRKLDLVLAAGGFACVGGLSAFLVLARPEGEGGGFTGAPVAPLAIVLGVIVVGAVLAARRFRGEIGAISLAAATGVLYGITAGLMKVVADQVRASGVAEPFGHWTLYVVCVIGPVGFLLSQQTFQRGKLISPALAVITTIDPLVSAAIGVSWFGERLDLSPAILAGEIVALLVLIAGVAVLTHRSEQLRRHLDRRHRSAGSTGLTWG
nr:DMT family transporter [Saccharopolyspora sp. HNM0983]